MLRQRLRHPVVQRAERLGGTREEAAAGVAPGPIPGAKLGSPLIPLPVPAVLGAGGGRDSTESTLTARDTGRSSRRDTMGNAITLRQRASDT